MDEFRLEAKTIDFGDSQVNKMLRTFNNVDDESFKEDDLWEDKS